MTQGRGGAVYSFSDHFCYPALRLCATCKVPCSSSFLWLDSWYVWVSLCMCVCASVREKQRMR